MSHIVCPICAMNRAISTYDPSNIELDLKVRTMRGKGRGQGFDHEDSSVLGDNEYSPMVAGRCLRVVKMFIDAGTLKVPEILSCLRINPTVPPINISTARAQQISEIYLRTENTKLRNQLNRIKRNKARQSSINQILEEIHNNKINRTEFTLRNGNLRLIIHESDPSLIFYLRNKIMWMDIHEFEHLREKIIVTDEYLNYYLWVWNRIKIIENNNQFHTIRVS